MKMRFITNGILAGALSLGLLTTQQTFAVVGQALSVQGTNLVLSWPSHGYEQYHVRYRQTLNPDDSWSCFTNAYPANSTNRTTLTIYGVVPPAGGGGGSFAAMSTSSSLAAESVGPLAVPVDGSGGAVPVAIYPPGFDFSNFNIFDPISGESIVGADCVSMRQSLSQDVPFPSGNPQPLDSTNSLPAPTTGFFQVFHIPSFPASITNYTFDGPIFIPIDFADYQERVENIQVLIDGQPMQDAEYMAYDGLTNWGAGIYFDRLTNGTHQIQLISTLHINDEINFDAIYLTLSNLARTITVSNQITFPDWNDFVQGDTYTFNIQTLNPNTDWQIDIFDAGYNYVNSRSGHTTDGHISWTWDLKDWMGNSRDDFESDPYFYSQTTFNTASGGGYSPAAQSTKPNPLSVKGYPDRGEWLIAFMDRWFSDAPGYGSDCQGKYDSAMQSVWYWPQSPYVGDTTLWYPIRFGTNVYSQADRDYSWTNLLAWIGDLHVRNLYYHGHGGANELGADRHELDTNGLVTGSALASYYSKAQIFSWQVAQKTRHNRYRFVFLDGCSTAAGSWPSAFNISQTTHSLDFYQNHPKHPRPSVFVGWAKDIGGKDYGNVYNRITFQGDWIAEWANIYREYSIQQALEQANFVSGWLGAPKFSEDIRCYGYQAMLIQEYNKKSDWRWP
jgi:hypothetical protein